MQYVLSCCLITQFVISSPAIIDMFYAVYVKSFPTISDFILCSIELLDQGNNPIQISQGKQQQEADSTASSRQDECQMYTGNSVMSRFAGYPAIRSKGRDTKLTVCFSFIVHRYGFLSRGFADWREILHGSSTISRTGLLPFLGDSPRVAEF